MSLKTPPMNVRLPGELGERFATLRREFAGLQPSVILRMLIADQLSKPLDAQIQIVVQQIRKPTEQSSERKQRHGLNAKNRLT